MSGGMSACRLSLIEKARDANPDGFPFIDFAPFTDAELKDYADYYNAPPPPIDPAYLDV